MSFTTRMPFPVSVPIFFSMSVTFLVFLLGTFLRLPCKFGHGQLGLVPGVLHMILVLRQQRVRRGGGGGGRGLRGQSAWPLQNVPQTTPIAATRHEVYR